jgi:HNH endonuclease
VLVTPHALLSTPLLEGAAGMATAKRTLNCIVCQTPFRVYPYRLAKHKFCSLKCKGQHQRLGRLDRFLAKIAVSSDGCWVWTAGVTRQVHGYAVYQGTSGHAWSYRYFVGEVATGLELDHLCRNKLCVNPTHLEPVTPTVNKRRSNCVSGINARKTHCKNGHAFTPDNILAKRGGRGCKACNRIACSEYWFRRRRFIYRNSAA